MLLFPTGTICKRRNISIDCLGIFVWLNGDGTSSDRLPQTIRSFASISSSIFRIRVENVQGDQSKLVSSAEAVTQLKGQVVKKPFNVKSLIADRNQSTFQMSVGSFLISKLIRNKIVSELIFIICGNYAELFCLGYAIVW